MLIRHRFYAVRRLLNSGARTQYSYAIAESIAAEAGPAACDSRPLPFRQPERAGSSDQLNGRSDHGGECVESDEVLSGRLPPRTGLHLRFAICDSTSAPN